MTNPGQNASLPTVEPATDGTSIILFGEMLADVFPDRSVPGGAPFNVARHLAAFGQKPLLVSRLGDDALGARMLDDMTDWGMDAGAIQIDRNRPTGRVQVHIEADGHRFEILPRQAYDFIDPHSAGAALEGSHPGLIYFGSLSQRHPVSRQALAAVLCQCAAPRFLDINLREPWYDEDTARFSLRQADIVKLNDEELRILTAMFGARGAGEQERARALKRMFDIDRLIVTSGSAGAWQLDGRNHVSEASSGKTPDIVDTVGAGDAFAAVCILGIFRGWPPAAALERADAFAAAICEIRGAVPDNREFYQPFLKEWTQ